MISPSFLTGKASLVMPVSLLSEYVRAFVLNRPCDIFDAEFPSGMKRPIRISEKRAAEGHDIGASVGDDLFAEIRTVQQPDRRGCDKTRHESP